MDPRWIKAKKPCGPGTLYQAALGHIRPIHFEKCSLKPFGFFGYGLGALFFDLLGCLGSLHATPLGSVTGLGALSLHLLGRLGLLLGLSLGQSWGYLGYTRGSFGATQLLWTSLACLQGRSSLGIPSNLSTGALKPSRERPCLSQFSLGTLLGQLEGGV